MSDAQAAWASYLDAGEKILWQGQPEAGLNFQIKQPTQHLMGLLFMGFSIIWMRAASAADGPFWMFGLIFFFVGMYNAFGKFFWRAYLRSKTWYTLTDRRAFIATDVPFKGRSLKYYPITDDTVIEYQNTAPANVYFAEEHRNTKNGSYRVQIGFERVADGDTAYGHIRAIQRGDYAQTS